MYLIVQYAAAKNTAQGYISPDDFNNKVMPIGQNGYFDFILGEYQKYQPTRPFPPVSFSGNERIRTSIAPLIYETVLPVNTTTGIANYPSDFEEVDAMWSLYNIYRIRFAQQDNLWMMRNSRIDPIVNNPVYFLNEYGINFLPTTVGDARMSYVRKPPPIIWGYTLDGNGIPVYDETTSQQPIWSESDIMQVIVRGLAAVGVNLQLGVVMQYANDVKNMGQ